MNSLQPVHLLNHRFKSSYIFNFKLLIQDLNQQMYSSETHFKFNKFGLKLSDKNLFNQLYKIIV